jgi:hypothetical protein
VSVEVGGLALLWVNFLLMYKILVGDINAIVSLRGKGQSWKFTGIYGYPDTSRRKETWCVLHHLKNF